MSTIDWLNLDIILFSFIKRLNRAIYENNSKKKRRTHKPGCRVGGIVLGKQDGKKKLTVSPHRLLFLEKANTMGPTTPFKIGHKWGDGYFYHFTARVYFFTFTLRLKEKLLRLNIFYDYRLRFEANSIRGQLLVTLLLYTVPDPFGKARQSSFQNSFHTLLFVFWWTKSDSIPDQEWGRHFLGEADSIQGQLLVTLLLYTAQDPFSKATQSSFQNSFHTLLFFFGGPSLKVKNEEEIFWVKPTPFEVSY